MRRKIAIILLIAAATGFSGCGQKDDQRAPNAQAREKAARRAKADLIILPEQAAPGQTVQVSYKKPAFGKTESVVVTFGDKPGYVLRISGPSTAVVLVPNVSPGPVDVTVQSDGAVLGKTTLTISHPPLLRLFFKVRNGRPELVRVQPYTGRPDDIATAGRRLSYDVLSDSDDLLYTAAIHHPAEAYLETFDEDGNIRREPKPGPATFILKVPYTEGPFRLQLLEAGAGLNLMDPGDRAQRVLIEEFTIQQEGKR